jgi:ATP phosphoribosyltransferase regulatory subunit
MFETVLKQEEKVALALQALYRNYGYLPYQMSKFEPYDLYVANKDFLVSDGVITFTDTDGKLLALKPDVTLSIIKNTQDGELQKVYYNENVYRISGETKQFKEIMQVGLECLGDIGAYEVYETVTLAALSLREISSSFVLDISHLGILSAMLKIIDKGETFNGEVMRCLADKNAHGLRAVCRFYGVDDAQTQKLITVLQAYGDMEKVLSVLAPICDDDGTKKAYDELSALVALLKNSPYYNRMRLDFSVVNDMSYYNGIVFKGFVDGVCEGVLSGGQYDRLMKRLGKKSRAIGFAVYTDLLERLNAEKPASDVDTLVLYDEQTDLTLVAAETQALQAAGKSFRVQKTVGAIRFATVLDLRKGGKV